MEKGWSEADFEHWHGRQMRAAVRDHPGDTIPFGVLTGDTLFIGDVGRPDLLGASGWAAEAWQGRSTARPANAC